MNNKVLLFLLLGIRALSASAEIRVATDAARDYGYRLGDELTITWQIRADGRLQTQSLPQPGPVNDWLVLKQIEPVAAKAGFDSAYQLTYQLFKRVPKAQPLALPDTELIFQRGRNEQKTTVPGFRFHYAPLLPGEDWAKNHDPKPEIAPPAIDNRNVRRNFFLSLFVTLCLTGYLVWFYGAIPWLERFTGPFARCLKELKKLKPGAEAEAIQRLHRAIDQTMGKTVSPSQLEAFFQAHPRYRTLAEDTRTLFAQSQALFFQPDAQAEISLSRLKDLCARYRKLERGGQWS